MRRYAVTSVIWPAAKILPVAIGRHSAGASRCRPSRACSAAPVKVESQQGHAAVVPDREQRGEDLLLLCDNDSQLRVKELGSAVTVVGVPDPRQGGFWALFIVRITDQRV